MKKEPDSDLRGKDLRRRAEMKLGRKKTKDAPGTHEPVQDTKKLLQELEVHQMELEMQNEELRSAKLEVEQLLNKYTELYDFAPVGYFTLDNVGRISEVNLTGARMLGVPRAHLLNRHFQFFFESDSRSVFRNFLVMVYETDRKHDCVLTKKRDGEVFFYRLEGTVTECSDDVGKQCLAALVDITKEKEAEMILQDSQQELEKKVNEAVSKIRTLSGMLSICASCKKIRDDDGYWKQIEAYVTEHTETEFTHGLCPECAKLLYPDI